LRGGELALSEIARSASNKVRLNAPDNFVRRNQIHAARQFFHDIHAKPVAPVSSIAVTQRNCSVTPASAARAAAQGAIVVNELVVWVRFPMGGFAAACDYHARTSAPTSAAWLDSGRQVHQ
jgi:hypothetical protein